MIGPFADWSGAGRFTIHLDALELTMGLGIHAQELAAPQRVAFSVTLYVDYGAVPPTDDIATAVDYDYVRTAILALAERRFALQETLCEAIAARCFADARVRGARVRSAKPDVYPDAVVGCEIIRVNPA